MENERVVEVTEYYRDGKMYKATVDGVDFPEYIKAYNEAQPKD